MSHFIVQNLLSGYVDGDLSDADRARVEEHLVACAECRAEHELLARTVELLRTLPIEPVPEGFTERLLARVEGERPARGDVPARVLPFPGRRAPVALAALAACALLAFGLLRLRGPAPAGEAPGQPAAEGSGDLAMGSAPPVDETRRGLSVHPPAAAPDAPAPAARAAAPRDLDALVDDFDLATGAEERPLAGEGGGAGTGGRANGRARGGAAFAPDPARQPAESGSLRSFGYAEAAPPARDASAEALPAPAAPRSSARTDTGTARPTPGGAARGPGARREQEPYYADWEKAADDEVDEQAKGDGKVARTDRAGPEAEEGQAESKVAQAESSEGKDKAAVARKAEARATTAPPVVGAVTEKALLPRVDVKLDTADAHSLKRVAESCAAAGVACHFIEPNDRPMSLDAGHNYQVVEFEATARAYADMKARLQKLGRISPRGERDDAPLVRVRLTVEYLP